jgi:glutathione peroxidase
MKPVHFLFAVAVMFGFFSAGPAAANTTTGGSLLDHEVRRLNSEETVNLASVYAGKVVLVVNTASKCAFTGQYEGLEALYAAYKDRGLVVLGFPSNDFGGQEPGNEGQIQDFCRLTYSVRFPMFAKTTVKKGQADPLFEALATAAGRYPKWNFHKYLVGRDGQLVDDYLSWTSPQSDAIVKAIERLL